MVTRPYTAVLVRGGETRVIDIDAPLEKNKAKLALQEKFPSERVVALIPGVHAGHSFAFGTQPYETDKQIDLFDTGYITKNNV